MPLRKRKYLFILIWTCLAFFIFFVGSAIHAQAALKIVPVYKVLQNTDSGTGEQVKNIWKQLIDIVNYFIIAVLIFVAFVQILRINISTYGIKKILPALILAIIGANFSFLFCRLLVDLANIVMSLFIHGADGAVSNTTLAENFSGGWADPKGFGLVPGVASADVSIGMLLWFTFAQLFVLAGAFITLLLAYLFFIRIWLIYFLVALAPLAFMATVLPQTKSVFTQWMSNFAKWVFLPVVSIFWIWLGNQWIGNVKEDYMMSFVFAGVCYYLAITSPFKMGGAVMTAWGGIGKKVWGKTGGAYLGNQLNMAKEHLGAGFETAKNYVRKKSGYRLLSRDIRIKQFAQRAGEERSAQEERIFGKYNKKRGDKAVLWETEMGNMRGEREEFLKYAQEDLINKGINDPNDPRFKLLQKYRFGSAMAAFRMEGADRAYAGMLDKGTEVLLDTGFWEDKKIAGLSLDERKKIWGFDKKDNDRANEQDWQNMRKLYSDFMVEGQENEMMSKKRKSDLLKIPMRERVAIHNVAEFKHAADDMVVRFERFGQKFEDILRTEGEEKERKVQQLNSDELKEYRKYVSAKQRLDKTARDLKIMDKHEDLGDREVLDRVSVKATENYKNKIAQIQNSNVNADGKLDIYLHDLVKTENGHVTGLNTMQYLQANRARIFVDGDIRDREREWIDQYGVAQLSTALGDLKGLANEGVTEDHLISIYKNQVDPDLKTNTMRKANAIVAGVRDSIRTGSQTNRQIAAEGWLRFLNNPKVNDMKELLRTAESVAQRVGERDKSVEFKQFNENWDKIEKMGGVHNVDINSPEHEAIIKSLGDSILYALSKNRNQTTNNKILAAISGEEPRPGDVFTG